MAFSVIQKNTYRISMYNADILQSGSLGSLQRIKNKKYTFSEKGNFLVCKNVCFGNFLVCKKCVF